MASGEGDCHKDPNFAVICSFLDKYGSLLGLQPICYSDLQSYLEDTTGDVSRVLIDIHVRLLRRIGKSIVNSDRFEKSIIKFCHHFSEFDAWEVESYGYKHAKLGTKLRILKNLLECQFDYNLKFKETINGQSAEEMRLLPIGRDKEGQAYWYFLDQDLNLLVYKEEQDDEDADTWKLVCRNRSELATLVNILQETGRDEGDKTSTSESKSSKEGSPDKEVSIEHVQVKEEKLIQDHVAGVVKDEKTDQKQLAEAVKEEKLVQEHVLQAVNDEKTVQVQVEKAIKKEKTGQEQMVEAVCKQEAAIEVAEAVKTVQEHAAVEEISKDSTLLSDGITIGASHKEIITDKSESANMCCRKDHVVNAECASDKTVTEDGHTDQTVNEESHTDNTVTEHRQTDQTTCKSRQSDWAMSKDRHTDQIVNEDKQTNQTVSRDKQTDLTASEDRQSDETVSEDKQTDQRVSEEQQTGQMSENKQIDQTVNENRQTDQLVIEGGHNHQTASDDRQTDQTVSKDRQIDKTVSEDKQINYTGNEDGHTDQMVTELKQTDQTISKDRRTDETVYENRLTDKTVSEDRHIEQSVSEDKQTDQIVTEDKQTNQIVGEERQIDQVTEDKQTDQIVGEERQIGQVTEDKQTDQTVGEERQIDQVTEDKQPDQTVSEERQIDQVVNDDKHTDQIMSKDRQTNETVNEDRLTDQTVNEKRHTHQSVSEDRETAPTVNEDNHTDQTVNEDCHTVQTVNEDSHTVQIVSEGRYSDQAVSVNIHQRDRTLLQTSENGAESAINASVAEDVADDLCEESEKEHHSASAELTDVVSASHDDDASSTGSDKAESNVKISHSAEDRINKQESKQDRCGDLKQTEPALDPCPGGGNNSPSRELKPEKAKVASHATVRDTGGTGVSGVGLKQSGEEKVASGFVVKETEEVTPDFESKESRQTNVSDIEMLETGENNITSDVKLSQTEKPNIASDVKLSQTEKPNIASDVDLKQAPERSITSEDDFKQTEKTNITSDVELKPIGEKNVTPSVELKDTSHSDSGGTTAEEKNITGIEFSQKKSTNKKSDIDDSHEEKKADSDSCSSYVVTKEDGMVQNVEKQNIECIDQSVESKILITERNSHELRTVPDVSKTEPELAQVTLTSVLTPSKVMITKGNGDIKCPPEGQKTPDEGETPDLLSGTGSEQHKCHKEQTQAEGYQEIEDKVDHSCATHEQLTHLPHSEHQSSTTSVLSGGGSSPTVEDQGANFTVKPTTAQDEGCATHSKDSPYNEEGLGKQREKAHKDDISRPSRDNGFNDLDKARKHTDAEIVNSCADDKLVAGDVTGSLELGKKSTVRSDSECGSLADTGARSRKSRRKQTADKGKNISDMRNGDHLRSATSEIVQNESEPSKNSVASEDSKPSNKSPSCIEDGTVDLAKKEKKSISDICDEKCRAIVKVVISRSQTEPQRKLKRSAPDPASDEPFDSEPNGKRARQATKTQKTRAGRNAAARGRAARLANRDSESDDSETPLSQVRGKGRGLARGSGGQRRTRSACPRKKSKNNQEACADDDGEDVSSGKRAKKKKPDSSSEALSEEEVTPAKKGRNQTQPSCPQKSTKAKKKGAKSKPAAPAPEEEVTGVRRSLRVRQLRARKPPSPSSPSEESDESSQDEDNSEDQEDDDKNFLDTSFTPEEESGDEEFKPKGRNFQRQAARTSKEESEELINDDTPCVKCGKYNHPEMILLCDKCDAGFHTACLRPPLMLIPDGDWFCPPCEHLKLVDRLLECLQAFDIAVKKKDRLVKRQERLAFVGISISNILHGDRKVTPSTKFDNPRQKVADEREVKSDRNGPEKFNSPVESETSSYESEAEPKYKYRSERLALRQAQTRSRKDHRRSRHKKPSPEVEVMAQRTCRTRAVVSYQFKEFDELISNAIEDDKPCKKEKPPGIRRGKDMSNILGASDEEDEKIRQRDGDSSHPPPVVRKKTRRRLTKLESDDDDDQDEDDSDEFHLSEEDDSDASEGEGEEEDEEDEEFGSSDSGDWKPKKTWYNSHMSSQRSKRRNRNFATDDNYCSDENASKRRSTRNSNRGRIHYSAWDSDEEETEVDTGSDYSSVDSRCRSKRAKKKITSRKNKELSDNTNSDSSITRRRKTLRKLIKKRRKDESESENTEKESEEVKKEVQKKQRSGKKDSEDSDFIIEQSESENDSEDSPKFKKKNVLRSSDEDEEEEEKAVAADDSKLEVETSKVNNVTEPPPPEKEAVCDPASTVASQEESVVKSKSKPAAKGKKRSDGLAEDDAAGPAVDLTVPGKVRRISGSDKDHNAVTEVRSPLPAAGVRTPAEGKKKQAILRQGRKSKEALDAQSCPPQQQDVIATKSCETPQSVEKPAGSGKKKTVPNFLDVNSGEESDDHKDSAVSSDTSDLGKAPAMEPVQHPTHGALTRADSSVASSGQHYQYSMGPYKQTAQGASVYFQDQAEAHAGSHQNPGMTAHDIGPPPHNSSVPPASAHQESPRFIHGFPDPVVSHSNSGHPVGAGMKTHPVYGEGPSSGHHPFSSGQAPNIKQEQHMPQTVFPGVPVSRHVSPIPVGAHHIRPGMTQQHCGGMQPSFLMAQQQHAHQNMGNDGSSNLRGYSPQGYGPGQLPPGQNFGPGAFRHPYYGMQSSPPHNMGQHFTGQYPVNLGSGPSHKMSSPLTSMGQMARKLGSNSNMHSPPPTQTVGSGEGSKERQSGLRSPPNREIMPKQEKITEMRDEHADGVSCEKDMGKVGKRRALSAKPKKKAMGSQPHNLDQSSPANHRPITSSAEGQDRISDQNQHVYRTSGQPYHMSPSHMPYTHGPVMTVNPQHSASYMGPRHPPPVSAQQPTSENGNNALPQDRERKGSRLENNESQPSMSSVEQKVNLAPYHQNVVKFQPRGQANLERRQSQSPVLHSSDMSAADPPSSEQVNTRTQVSTAESVTQVGGIPAPSHTTEMPLDLQACNGRPSGPAGASRPQDHSLHGQNPSPYSQGSGLGGSLREGTSPYYSTGPYYSHYNPQPNPRMPHSGSWSTDIQGYGTRCASSVYPYGPNQPVTGNRMSNYKPGYDSKGLPASELPKSPVTESAVSQDIKPNIGESPGSVVKRSTPSSDYHLTKPAEVGQTPQKQLELDTKPPHRHCDGGTEREIVSTANSHRSVPVPECEASQTSSLPTTLPSSTAPVAPHLSDGRTQGPVSTHSSVESSTLHPSTSNSMSQSHKISHAASMGPQNTWSRPSMAVQYSQQHVGQWANMGGPRHYSLTRPYGGPAPMIHSPYRIDSQPVLDAGPMGRKSGQAEQKPFPQQGYEARFQSSRLDLAANVPETEYPRSAYSGDYCVQTQYWQQPSGQSHSQDGVPRVGNRVCDREDQVTEGNTASKPKRAKTQKKTSTAGIVRGKSGKGRGRGRGGFMIDNLLQARGVEVEEGEDSAEMNDIVSYVTTDEYFKQQTSSSGFTHQTEIGFGESKH